MELLIPVWLIGLAWYFTKTTPQQREDHLLIMWAVLLAPVVFLPLWYWLR